MRIVLCTVVVALMSFVADVSWAAAYYIDVRLQVTQEDSSTSSSSRAGFRRPVGKSFDGLFWLGDESHGGYTGHGLAGVQEGIEIHYDLKLQTEAGLTLTGVIWLMEITADGAITGGRKRDVHEPVVIGDTVAIGAGTSQDGRRYALHVVVAQAGTAPAEVSAPITLFSTRYVNGQSVAQVKHSSNRLNRAHAFETGFSGFTGREEAPELQYMVQIKFLDDPAVTELPLQTKIQFNRVYRLRGGTGDTHQWSSSYSSQYVHDITLERGVQLQLVIPPDTPSVHGFDIVDSLIIEP